MDDLVVHASAWERFLVVPGLILTTVIATTLFATRLGHWTSSPGFAAFVDANRSATGIFVQIISHMLGTIHVFALCNTINLSTRTYLAKTSFSLVLIKFLNAICGNRFDWSLPWFHKFALFLFMIFAILPAALWAGALTPVDSSKATDQQITVPGYSNMTILEGVPYHSQFRNIYNKNTNKGMFTFMPQFDLQGTMLDLAADSSNRSGGTNTHSKMDRTNYRYVNRSYGVGASVGLGDDALLPSTTSYNFTETGLVAETSCIYNSSADFYLTPNILPDDSGWLLEVFEAVGSLPWGNGKIDFVTAGFNAQSIVTLIAASNGSRHIMGITTGSNGSDWYAPLRNVQCDIYFTPTNFSVLVDTTNQIILVNPLENVTWPPFANLVSTGAVQSISTMGQALSTTMFVSILGQALMYNIANVEAAQGISNSSSLQGIESAITSMLDNMLVTYASAQLMIADQGVETPVSSQTSAIVLGTPLYIFPIFALNLLVCLVYLIESCRTGGWRRVSPFNFMDIKSVVISASSGGTAVAYRARRLQDNLNSGPSAQIRSTRGSSVDDYLPLELAHSSQDGGIAVVLAREKIAAHPYTRRFGNPFGRAGRADDGALLLQEYGRTPSRARSPSIEPDALDLETPFSSSYQLRVHDSGM